MTGPTTSVLSTSNVGTLAFCRASTTTVARCSIAPPSPGGWGSRIMIWFSSASPYRWTVFSPGSAVRAVRTASSVTGWSNSTTTSVPPEKSIPSGTPRVAMSPIPLRMMSHDSARAGHRQRSQSMLTSVRIRIVSGTPLDTLDTQGCHTAARQDDFKHRARDEYCRKHVGRQADRQRGGEAADRTGAELEQEHRGNQRRHMGVDDGPPHAVEARVDRRFHRLAGSELLFDALEDQHVRVDTDANRQDEAGKPGQGHRRAEVRHHAEKDHEIRDDRRERVQPRQAVIEEHEGHDEQ